MRGKQIRPLQSVLQNGKNFLWTSHIGCHSPKEVIMANDLLAPDTTEGRSQVNRVVRPAI